MREETIQKRQEAEKKLVIESLKKVPIIQIACERSNISRPTYYRWRKDDEEFKKDSDDAMRNGKDMINDLSESQLISLIKDKNFHAIQLWLRQHHTDYGNRLEVKSIIGVEDPLTSEQEALIREALGVKKEETYGTQT